MDRTGDMDLDRVLERRLEPGATFRAPLGTVYRVLTVRRERVEVRMDGARRGSAWVPRAEVERRLR